MPGHQSPFRRPFALEPLEPRRLLSVTWGANPQLIAQDLAAENFPEITGAGQTIAVIDTGIDYTHEAFDGFGDGMQIVAGYDFVDDDDDPLDTDPGRHGTSVAGVIAANPFVINDRLYQGVAPDAGLVVLRVAEDDEPVPATRLQQALQWVIDHRETYDISVVNISFGFEELLDESSPPFSAELDALYEQGVFIVAASGNTGVADDQAIQYPASHPAVFSAGTVTRFDVIREATVRGPDLDILAPGQQVFAPAAGPDQYALFTGTSYSAPFIAGAAALIRQVSPGFAPDDIRSILRASGIDNFDGDDETGVVTNLTFPRLDLNNALALADARAPGDNFSAEPIGGDAAVSDIAFDRDGVLHMIWHDQTQRNLKYAARSTQGLWSDVQIVDDRQWAGQHLSLALDGRGRPAAAYFDGGRGALRYAAFDGADFALQPIELVQSVGLYPSLVFDADDRPAISYYHRSLEELRLARLDGGDWSIQTIDGRGFHDVGRSSSLALTPDGTLAVAYANTTTGQLKYAWETGDGGWLTSIADRQPAAGVSHLSLAFDPDGIPSISYHDAGPGNLRFAQQRQGQPGFGWDRRTLDHRGVTGLFSQVIFDTSGRANVFYYDPDTDALLRARGRQADWNVDTLVPSGGRALSATLDPDDRIVFAWLDSATATLRVDSV